MSHEQDWQEFRDAIRITRKIMHQPALDAYRMAKLVRASTFKAMLNWMIWYVIMPRQPFAVM